MSNNHATSPRSVRHSERGWDSGGGQCGPVIMVSTPAAWHCRVLSWSRSLWSPHHNISRDPSFQLSGVSQCQTVLIQILHTTEKYYLVKEDVTHDKRVELMQIETSRVSRVHNPLIIIAVAALVENITFECKE